jgi:hypothetical protein
LHAIDVRVVPPDPVQGILGRARICPIENLSQLQIPKALMGAASRALRLQADLLKMPALANSTRGNRAYRFLPSRTWQKIIRDQASLNSLAALEEEMEKEITFLIDNPHLIPLCPKD